MRIGAYAIALNEERLAGMAQGIRDVIALPDPVGAVRAHIERPNGLVIEQTAVPMGVLAIIYESRPNVTSDAAALALKSGNVCVLRCGREAWATCKAITDALRGSRAAACDVSSGVETRPGVKNHDAIQKLVNALRKPAVTSGIQPFWLPSPNS